MREQEYRTHSSRNAGFALWEAAENFSGFSPSQRLWRAVILQVLQDAYCRSRKPEMQSHRREALKWLLEKNSEMPMVCEWAGISPSLVRRVASCVVCENYHRTKPRCLESGAERHSVTKNSQNFPVPAPQELLLLT